MTGDILSSTGGTWNGTPTITEGYQWQRCDASGANCLDISGAGAGALSSDYVVQNADIGHTLRAKVIAPMVVVKRWRTPRRPHQSPLR